MKRPNRSQLLVLLPFLFLTSCGGERKPAAIPESPAQVVDTITNPDGTVTVLECHPAECETGKYCLVTLQKKQITEARCVPVPSECSDCGCLKEDGLKQFNPAVKCSLGSTYCANADGKFTVSCEKR